MVPVWWWSPRVWCSLRFACGELLKDEQVSTLFLTTALFNQCVQQHPEAFCGLRHLLFAGEMVQPQWVRRLLEHSPPERLLHVYGPTENTTFSTWYEVQVVAEGARTVPIGKSIANSQAYVLDGGLHPVPAGMVGELYLGGAGLALGYWNQEALTAERFIAAPWNGDRLYRTGDLVRVLEQGDLEFIGRRDQQVKVRGFRVELSEIETCLHDHPAVLQAAVTARPTPEGHLQLAAYVVVTDDSQLSEQDRLTDLRTHLKQRLPDYMLPQHLRVLNTLPLNRNGKVDHASLPEIDSSQSASPSLHFAPRTPYEQLVAESFSEILQVNQVGLHDNFFELGGHSLLAMQALSRIAKTFGVELPVRVLFEAPTVGELAKRIESALTEENSLAPPLCRRDQPRLPAPLSFAQQRLWFLHQLAPHSSAYNIPLALRFHGRLDEDALQAALNELVTRQAALRTRFVAGEGPAQQQIESAGTLPLAHRDLSSLPVDQRLAEAQRLASS